MKRRYWAGLVLVVVALVLGVVWLQLVVLSADVSGASHLSVEQVDTESTTTVDATETVAFEELTAAQQQVFTSALDAENGQARIPTDVDGRIWVEYDYVTHQNQTYRVAVATP